MSPVLPFDIIPLIIDIVGENEDTDLLKELALVSHCFLQICSKHLFATVELHDAAPRHHVASSKKGFVKLLKSRPEVVKYIRKLTYNVPPYNNTDDHLLSPILFNLLPTFSHLNSLSINTSHRDWNTLDASLISALLHLIHLPTINHIDLSCIQNFPLSSLTPSVNLLRLDIYYLCRSNPLEEDGSPELVVQSEMMPKIREFYTSSSSLLTTKLLHAKRSDGQPAFNFVDLRRLSIFFTWAEDEQNIRYLLQNAKVLEKLHLSVVYGRSLVGLLSLSARTLKVLDLSVSLWEHPLFLEGICEELEALAGHNMLEALSFVLHVGVNDTEDFIGSIIQKMGNVLVKSGWFALRQVSFKLPLARFRNSRQLCEALQSIPDKYLSHLSKLKSIAFDYTAYVV